MHNASQKGTEIDVPVLAATVRQKVCDILINHTVSAAEEFGYKTVTMAGGVSANSELRARMEQECKKRGIALYYPPLSLCGDNAAMVGAQGFYEYNAGNTADVSLNAAATLDINYNSQEV